MSASVLRRPIFCICTQRLSDRRFIDLSSVYTIFHRYFCALICFCGVTVNLVHIVVLTRKQMRCFAVNSILSVMAICDVIIMSLYFVYIIRFRVIENEDNTLGYTYGWLVFLLIHVVLSIALHTIGLYLSVFMAYVRWIALDRLDSDWIRTRPVGRIFFGIATTIFALSIPTLLVHEIVPFKRFTFVNENYTMNLFDNITYYTVGLIPQATDNSCRLFKANLWLTGIFFKVIPCLLLFWFTVALMRKLNETSRKRIYLLGEKRKKMAMDKTTLMLIIMLFVFLCTELPQGALAILNAMYTSDIHAYVYMNLGELLDLLSLINCNVGFVLYCCMSSRYRSTFRHTFWLPASTAASAISANFRKFSFSL
uniref:G-protein coupled receptors family 1 profile domain-containing protein n=1 Tax=Parascaris univalens TaxID=6257 RepID=A0A915AIL5_PARUN